METNIFDYVVRRIKEISEELEEGKSYLQVSLNELEKAEEKIHEDVLEYEEGLKKSGKYSQAEIEESVTNMVDYYESRLDDAREEIEDVKNHIAKLENDLIIYQNYGR